MTRRFELMCFDGRPGFAAAEDALRGVFAKAESRSRSRSRSRSSR
jgi:hypothetical protein